MIFRKSFVKTFLLPNCK